MKNQITIASIQMYCFREKKKNLEAMEECLQNIKNSFSDVKLVVFPELALQGAQSDLNNLSVKIPGQATDVFSLLAKKHQIWIIPGSIYERSGNEVFNTTPIFSPNGDYVGKYRKRYPWRPNEKTTPGNKPFVFSLDGLGKVGIMICYDLWFPEVARDLVNQGAELIIVPTMTTTGDRPQEKIIARATAITQQCYLVSCNGVGHGGVGGSLIVDPEGGVLQESGEGPSIQTAIVDFERVRAVRAKGIAGVTNPIRDFKENTQIFSVYKQKTEKE